jgi:signal transduction histidine kinase
MSANILFLASVFLLLGGSVLAQGTVYEYEVKQSLERNAGFVFPADMDGDKTDELVILDDMGIRGSVSIINQDSRYIAQYRFGSDASFSPSSGAFRGGDGKDRLILSYRTGDSLFLSIIGGEPVWQKKIFLQKRPLLAKHSFTEWSGEYSPCYLYDINGDGSEDLIGLWITGVANYPRGVAAYDLKAGREIWNYGTGAQLKKNQTLLRDVNGDGIPEIILGTVATANGADFNGSNDLKAYVLVLDLKGKLIWIRELGALFESIRAFHAFDKDGRTMLLCQKINQGKYEGQPDRLLLLDANNGTTVRSIDYGKQGMASVLVDLDNTGEMQLITGNTDGTIRAYSQELDLVSEYLNSDGVGVNVMGVDDFDKDGNKDIIAFTNDGAFLVLNHRMELKYSGKNLFANETDYFTVVKHDGEKRIGTFIINKFRDNTFILSSLSRKPIITRSSFQHFIIITVLSAVILWLMSYLYLLRRKPNVLTSAIDGIRDIGIIITEYKGKVIYINEWANKALSNGSRKAKGRNFSELIKEKIEPGCDFRVALGAGEGINIRVRCLEIYNGLAVILSDETWHDHCRRISSWAPVAQEMAHGIKTPLTTILLAAQKISAIMSSFPGKQTALKYSRSIEEEAQRLQRVADGFMRIVQMEAPVKTAVEISSYLEGIVDEKRASLDRGLVMDLEASQTLPLVYIDPLQMKAALGNIIDNALTAASGGGRIDIGARSVEIIGSAGVEEMLEISVTDNGCGIKETYLKQLFTPFASFRPGGTGLGLVLAKKIIQDHGGTIKIDSKEDHGTAVVITLPSGMKA